MVLPGALRIRLFVTPTYKVGLALAIIYTAKLFSFIHALYQKDSGQAGMTAMLKSEDELCILLY
jgi:hypothetical protein